MATNYSAIANLPNLGPGSTGASVTALQNWLVANGYLTQAQMNTGPGTYGPQTTAAVAKWQSQAGINTAGNPGYFGPVSKTYIQSQSSAPSTPAPAPSTPPTMSLPFTPPSNSGTTPIVAPTVPQPQGSPSGNTSAPNLGLGGSSSQPNNNASIAGLGNLGPGSSGAQVQQLQNWLVQNGYMTQAQVDTGYGTYGPQTTAAVAAWQKANGIDTQGNPGYFGPISQNFLTTGGTSSATPGSGAGSGAGSGGSTGDGGTGGGTTAPATGTGTSATGDPQLDAILTSLQGLLDNNKAAIPAGLQITPALTSQFLAWAHQVVDPQTQQLINQHVTAINSNLQQLQTDYQNQQGQALQDFGMNLASGDNTMAGAGVAMSGLRNLTDQNLVNSTNRTLSSLAADTQNTIGQTLNTGAAQVGASNAAGFQLPNLAGASVSLNGGSYGSNSAGPGLNYNYNPSNYTMGTDISTGTTNVANQQANYLSQYGTLAGNNSTRSMSDLIGGITGLPAGYTIPAGLT